MYSCRLDESRFGFALQVCGSLLLLSSGHYLSTYQNGMADVASVNPRSTLYRFLDDMVFLILKFSNSVSSYSNSQFVLGVVLSCICNMCNDCLPKYHYHIISAHQAYRCLGGTEVSSH